MKKMKARKFPIQAEVLQKLRNKFMFILRDAEKFVGIKAARWHRLENGYLELKASEIVKINHILGTDILKEIQHEQFTKQFILSRFNVPAVCTQRVAMDG